MTVIPLGAMLPLPSSNLPENHGLGKSVFLFGLASSGACLAYYVTIITGGLLPHRFTLTISGGLLSVALAKDRSFWALPSTLPCEARTFLPIFDDMQRQSAQLKVAKISLMTHQGSNLPQKPAVCFASLSFLPDVGLGNVLPSKSSAGSSGSSIFVDRAGFQ